MDLDDQLQMLQRELMAVQEEKTNPLSERTVAQIMVKLHHDGFAFIPTTDGNQYVTPEKFDEEVVSLVRERGKIGVSIIPQLLNIGPDILEARLGQMIKKSFVTRHGPNLFSQKYFDTLLVGLAQRLQEEGRIQLENIAVQHQFNMEFAEKFISENVHKLKAELDGRQLITKEYTFLEKAKILGFLSAIRKPLQIQILYKALGSEAKNAEKLVLQLLSENKVKGRFANGYYIPSSFTSNQKKIVSQFLDNNGYLDAQMLQKKFMIGRPDDWIDKNMGSNSVKIQNFYFKEDKLESLAAQLNSLLTTEGYLQLAHVLPVDFDQKSLQQFLEDRCELKEYFLCEGYCYSNQWLERLTLEFKHKIIHNIFFKKPEPKGKEGKKKWKKEKVELVTEQELQEMLFNGGYADYTMAQTLAPQLHELILRRLQDLRKKIEKELGQSKGLISSTFLKYKNCKSILRNQDSLNMTINIIQKQIKKGEKWVDPDFGPSEADPNGNYAVIYYDNIVPKGWPSLQTLKWKEVQPTQLLKSQQDEKRVYPMKKCLAIPLCQLISIHNAKAQFKIPQPMKTLKQDAVAPHIYQFFINEKQKRYVLVDNMIPFIEGNPLASFSSYSFLQKAYAKFRYCYKGILGVGLHQMLLEMTGKTSVRYSCDTEKEREKMFQVLHQHVENKDFVVVMAEGEADKKLKIDEEEELQLQSLQPYLLQGKPEQILIAPSQTTLSLKQVIELFRNIFVIPSS